MAKKSSRRKKSDGGTVPGPSGRTFTKTITQGPNKGDRVVFKVSPSGKPYPTRVLNDKGNNSTLKGDVPFGGRKKTARKK